MRLPTFIFFAKPMNNSGLFVELQANIYFITGVCLFTKINFSPAVQGYYSCLRHKLRPPKLDFIQ